MKALTRLWWNTVKRATRVQQKQGRKLLKALLVKSKPTSKRGIKATPTARQTVKKSPDNNTPGRWIRSFISSYLVTGALPERRMSYWLYLPSSSPSGTPSRTPLPLVVMLHGCDQTAEEFAQGTGMNRLAEKQG